MNNTGMNTVISETVIEMMVKLDLARAFERRLKRSHAVLDVPHDVLEHDDGVVDHEADRERQCEQGDVVDGKPNAYMAAQVPTSEIGSASAAIAVADAERRNSRITRMTSPTAISSVSCTSHTASRIGID